MKWESKEKRKASGTMKVGEFSENVGANLTNLKNVK